MLHLCTYFDHRYLIYAIALYRSLMRCAGGRFTLHALCCDDEAFVRMESLALPAVRLIRRCELEQAYPSLLKARKDRSLLEYYWTLMSALPSYVLSRNPEIEFLAFADSDLYFYSAPDPIIEELGRGSILIVPHRTHDLPASGTFNDGLILFRNCEAARACLSWWRERCIEWCYDRYENGKCGPQGYLEDWPVRFRGVVVSQHKGIGLAPWNAGRYTLQFKDAIVLVDSDPLVFYHFGGVRMTRQWLFTHNLPVYRTRMTCALKDLVYAPYIRELRRVARDTRFPPRRDLRTGTSLSFAERLRGQFFRSWLLVIGPLILDFNFGQVRPLLGRIRKWLFG